MAAAAVVFDDGPPPPELKRMWQYQRFGINDVMELPAGMMERMTGASNVYDACSGYRAAKQKVEWADSHPMSWRLVSGIIAERKNVRSANTR